MNDNINSEYFGIVKALLATQVKDYSRAIDPICAVVKDAKFILASASDIHIEKPLTKDEIESIIEERIDEKTKHDSPVVNLNVLKKEVIEAALLESGGNRRYAAKMLGISERTIYRKIEEYNIKID